MKVKSYIHFEMKLMSILLLILLSSSSVDAGMMKNMDIILDEYQDEYDLEINETKTVTVTGIVYCEFVGPTDEIVSLQVNAGSWISSIKPESLTFSTTGIYEEEFTVEMKIDDLEYGDWKNNIEISISQLQPEGSTLLLATEVFSIIYHVEGDQYYNETSNVQTDTSSIGPSSSGSIVPIILVAAIVIVSVVIVGINIRKRRK